MKYIVSSKQGKSWEWDHETEQGKSWEWDHETEQGKSWEWEAFSGLQPLSLMLSAHKVTQLHTLI